MQFNIAPLALVGLSFLAAPVQASEGWIQEFDKAVQIAKEQKKDLLVDFTGSDWCGWCIKLDKEVFAHEAFSVGVASNFVLVSLDFPKGEEAKAKVPDLGRNRELQKKYGVTGFPTILLMNSDGVVYGKTGYQKGGPEAYVKHLNELRETGRRDLVKTTDVLAAYNAAEGAAKLEALGKLADVLAALPEDSNFAEMLIEPARKALELDPKNEKGIKLKAVRGLSKAGVHSTQLLAAARELDAKNEGGVLELAIMAQFQSVTDEPTAKAAMVSLDALNKFTYQDTEIAFLMNFTAANWAAGPMSDPEAAKLYAAIAKKVGNDNEEMIGALDKILGS